MKKQTKHMLKCENCGSDFIVPTLTRAEHAREHSGDIGWAGRVKA